MNSTPWIVRPAPHEEAGIRLFCLPYAGAGALIYRSWPAALSRSVDVCLVQLPGRESRLLEALLRHTSNLIPPMTQALRPWLDRPFVIFGHSLGALLGFELARNMQRLGTPAPELLIASAVAAPHIPRTRFISGLDDEQFVEELHKLGGTSPEVLANEDLRRVFLPVLRADMHLCETYRPSGQGVLNCAISAFGGASDPETPRPALLAWRDYTRAFTWRIFPGGHFFIHSQASAVLAAVTEELDSCIELNAGIL